MNRRETRDEGRRRSARATALAGLAAVCGIAAAGCGCEPTPDSPAVDDAPLRDLSLYATAYDVARSLGFMLALALDSQDPALALLALAAALAHRLRGRRQPRAAGGAATSG